MTAPDEEKLRRLPSVDKVVRHLEQLEGTEPFSHDQKVEATRHVLSEIRQAFPEATLPDLEEIVQQVSRVLEAEHRCGLRPVVNATGIVLHTNLGRAVLPKEAMEALQSLNGCCNLQIDLDSGKRGRREVVIEKLMQTLTGAEAATIVNNNAGATLLVLAALCRGIADMQTLASDAFLEKDLTKAYLACVIDPCTSASATPTRIKECFNKLLEADRKWLEPYWGKDLAL